MMVPGRFQQEVKLLPWTTYYLDIYRNKWVRRLTYLCFLSMLGTLFINVTYCLVKMNKESFAQFGPISIAMLYLVINMFAAISSFDSNVQIKVLSEHIFQESVSTLEWKFAQSLMQRFRKSDLLFFYNVALVLLMCWLMMRDMEYRLSDFLVFVGYLEKHWGILWPLVLLTYRCLNFIAFITVLNVPQQCLYNLNNLKFHLFVLQHEIEKCGDGLRSLRVHPKAIIEMIISKHQKILRFNAFLRQKANRVIMMMAFSVMIGLIFIAQQMFSRQFSILVSFILVFESVYFIWLISYHGQILENTMDDICQQLYHLNWYDWDTRSAKTLLIMLMNISIPLDWNSVTPSQSINYGYFKEFINFLYSTGRLFYSVFYQNN